MGGSTVRRWDGVVLAAGFVGLGLGVMGALLVEQFAPVTWRGTLSSVVLWLGMGLPVAYALLRSRPVGLLRIRSVDLLYAVVLGLALRMLQGVVAGTEAFPTVMTWDGVIPASWWWTSALPSVLVSPVVEEFFFRGLLLVAVFAMLRKAAGRPAAGFAAAMVSTGVFVLLHAVDGALPVAEAVPLVAVGLVCSLLVLLTGRIWGAVLVHVVYNLTGIALVVAGTLLA